MIQINGMCRKETNGETSKSTVAENFTIVNLSRILFAPVVLGAVGIQVAEEEGTRLTTPLNSKSPLY